MNTIKKITVAAAFLCVATVANAQEGISFGARFGYSMQSIDMGDMIPNEYFDINMGMLGIGAGVVVNIPAGPVVIAPELAFMYRNAVNVEEKSKYLGPNEKAMTAYEKEFAISIPVMVKFFSAEVWIGAGIQLDVPIAAEMCFDYGDGEECEKLDGKTVTETDVYDPLPEIIPPIIDEYAYKHAKRASIDIGIPIGIGSMITPNLGVDFRLVWGLNKLVKKEDEDVTEETGTMKSLGLGLTYLF